MTPQEKKDFVRNNYLTMSDEAMAKHIGTTAESVRNIRKRLGLRKVINSQNAHLVGQPVPVPKVTTIEEDRQIKKLKETSKETDKKYKQMLAQIELLEKELEASLEMKERLSPITIELSESKSDGEAVAVVLASDWHLEEAVRPETVNGLNKYNLKIAEERARQFFQNTLKLVNKEQEATKINTLVLALLGDFISGNIHTELLENCLLRPIEAIIFAENIIAGGIDYLLEHSDLNLIIPCAVGNHTRITHKVHISNEQGNSLETFMYHHLRNRYQGNERVTFHIAEGYLSYLDIYGYTLCFQHGHAVKYGGGIGGLTIPLNKAIAQWQKLRYADLYCLGHWHTFTDTGNAIVNGSLIGYNAFAVFIKAGFEKPKQAFFLIDKKRKTKTVVCPILFEI